MTQTASHSHGVPAPVAAAAGILENPIGFMYGLGQLLALTSETLTAVPYRQLARLTVVGRIWREWQGGGRVEYVVRVRCADGASSDETAMFTQAELTPFPPSPWIGRGMNGEAMCMAPDQYIGEAPSAGPTTGSTADTPHGNMNAERPARNESRETQIAKMFDRMRDATDAALRLQRSLSAALAAADKAAAAG